MPVDAQSLNSLKIDRSARGGESDPAPRRWLWIALAVAAAGVLAGFLLWPRLPRVVVAEVKEGSRGPGGANAVLNASGYVTARRQATISSKLTGKVVEVNVEEGMKVEAGQVLARLDDSQTQVQLALARAQKVAAEKSLSETEARLIEAELNLKRTRELVAQGVRSQADLDAAVADADALRAHLAAQREDVKVAERGVAVVVQQLDDLVIRAPFSGIAISKNAQPGEMISPISAGGGFTRTGISTVVDMASLEIEVDVNETYIQRVQAGQKVAATLDAYPEWQIPAHVITTIPSADRQKATVKVRIGFEQLDPRILPDMGVKVAFLGVAPPPGGTARRSTLVPRAALRGEAAAPHVFVVVGDRLERRAVKVAPGENDPVEVEVGLAAGERVVVGAPAEIKEGDRVKIRRPS